MGIMINKYYLDLIVNEVKNFNELQEQYGYENLDNLIGHYIEEEIISSREDLFKILNVLKKKIGIGVNTGIFEDWWVD